MPLHGDQYNSAAVGDNSPHHPTGYTELEFSNIRDSLRKQLGPEWTQSRDGPSRSTVYYIPTHRAIDLANHIFGFNGWSSSIKDVHIDFVDADDKGNLHVGCSVVCRITLKDGTFHEDVGYGESKSRLGKAAAFEHARKTASSDALKRTLRQFGSAMGNCIYDKAYLSDLRRLPHPKIKMDVSSLYRHPSLGPPIANAPPAQQLVKQESAVKTQIASDSTGSGNNDKDEYAIDAFDELAFLTEDDLCMLNGAIAHDESDETTVTEPLRITGPEIPNHSDSRTSSNIPGNVQMNKGPPDSSLLKVQGAHNNSSYRPQNHHHHQGAAGLNQAIGGATGSNTGNSELSRGINGPSTSIHAPGRQNVTPSRASIDIQQRNQHLSNLSSTKPKQLPQAQASYQNQPNQSRPSHPNVQPSTNGASGQIQRNQPNNAVNSSKYASNGTLSSNSGVKNNPPQGAPSHQQAPPNQQKPSPQNNAGPPAVGFYNSRAADHFAKDSAVTSAPANLVFDPKAPFKGKGITQGVSHSTSAPVSRQIVSQSTAASAAGNRPGSNGISPQQQNHSRSNYVNPQTDTNRKIGMPPTVAGQSPMVGNRTPYKPPTSVEGSSGNLAAGAKRSADAALGRSPLTDVSNGQNVNHAIAGEEQVAKRQRTDSGENGGVTVAPK